MSRKMTRQVRPIVGLMLASAMFCAGGVAVVAAPAPQAHAVSMSEYQAKVSNHAKLKSQRAGVSSDLADTILQLADLNDNQIPAAVEAAESAQQAAEQAQSLAEATTQRLQAAQQDKANLEEQIKQTGKDYDDAHAAVAQLARDEMHGSNASDVMSVVTGATSTQDFVNSMQSRDALSRNEANAASSAATSLSTSKNRGERLAAIEKQIAVLKTQADEKAASAQTAAETAQSERDALDKLRQEGEARRDELSSMIDSLDSQSAKQAAQTVLIASQVDSYNRQYQKEQQDAANRVDTGNQGGTPTTPVTPTPTPTPTPAPTPTVPSGGGNSSGQGTSNGDYGNAYATGQCTYWAYERRKQMGIGTPSYLGNGGYWWRSAPSYGLRVDHNPQVGAALSFLPGQDGADGTWGHVAVVEAVYGDGTFQISEMNWGGPWNMHYRTLTNLGQYWFVH